MKVAFHGRSHGGYSFCSFRFPLAHGGWGLFSSRYFVFSSGDLFKATVRRAEQIVRVIVRERVQRGTKAA